jgi:hypothetical protein
MLRVSLILATVVLLVLGGVGHGLWTQRWSSLTEAAVHAAGDRLADVPLKVGNWDGHPVTIDDAALSEDLVGRNRAIRYVHRVSGNAVVVYLACGRPATMEGHTPLQCYPAHGYQTVVPETRVAPLPEAGSSPPQFWVATFAQGQAPVPVHLRVFWCWKDAGGWRAPDNPGRAFRTAPYLYKCYAVRPLASPEEPLEGDPCVDLFRELLPELSRVLDGGN